MKKRIAELEMENEIFKKTTAIFSKKTIWEIVAFINRYKARYTVKRICKVLKFVQSTIF